MEKQWYFNTVTEQPELGMISPASHRMGPYKTREDALDAWKIVQERNIKWEEQDREWKRWSSDEKQLIRYMKSRCPDYGTAIFHTSQV